MNCDNLHKLNYWNQFYKMFFLGIHLNKYLNTNKILIYIINKCPSLHKNYNNMSNKNTYPIQNLKIGLKDMMAYKICLVINTFKIKEKFNYKLDKKIVSKNIYYFYKEEKKKKNLY
jgi:protein-arginine kinase activator protein McsA